MTSCDMFDQISSFRYKNKEISQENFTSKIWDLVKIPLLQQNCCMLLEHKIC
jgi:hypothetical protein